MPDPIFTYDPVCPAALLRDPALTAGEKVMLVTLVGHCAPLRGRMEVWPSNRRLAALTGTSVRQAQRLLGALVRKGYLRRSEREHRCRRCGGSGTAAAPPIAPDLGDGGPCESCKGRGTIRQVVRGKLANTGAGMEIGAVVPMTLTLPASYGPPWAGQPEETGSVPGLYLVGADDAPKGGDRSDTGGGDLSVTPPMTDRSPLTTDLNDQAERTLDQDSGHTGKEGTKEGPTEILEGLVLQAWGTGEAEAGAADAKGAALQARALLKAYGPRQDELVAVLAELAARQAISGPGIRNRTAYLWRCVRNGMDPPTPRGGGPVDGGVSASVIESQEAVDALDYAARLARVDPEDVDQKALGRLVNELGRHDLPALCAVANEVGDEGVGRSSDREIRRPFAYFVGCLRKRWADRENVRNALAAQEQLPGEPVPLGDVTVYLPQEKLEGLRQTYVGGQDYDRSMRRGIVRFAWLDGQLSSDQAAAMLAAED